jgi:hypothetical protein
MLMFMCVCPGACLMLGGVLFLILVFFASSKKKFMCVVKHYLFVFVLILGFLTVVFSEDIRNNEAHHVLS